MSTPLLERTALEREATPGSIPAPSPALDPAAIVARRREAMQAIDATVQAVIRERMATAGAGIDMTIYDAVYRAAPAIGGQWSVSGSRIGFFGVQTDSTTITLEFDREQQPARFHVHGAATVVSEDATAAALGRALAVVIRTGPRSGWAPGFVPGFAL